MRPQIRAPVGGLFEAANPSSKSSATIMNTVMKRKIGQTEIEITPVALGCWPIAGMTSIDVNDSDSLKTLHAAVEKGVNFFDTAYCYGANGESEKLAKRRIQCKNDKFVFMKFILISS